MEKTTTYNISKRQFISQKYLVQGQSTRQKALHLVHLKVAQAQIRQWYILIGIILHVWLLGMVFWVLLGQRSDFRYRIVCFKYNTAWRAKDHTQIFHKSDSFHDIMDYTWWRAYSSSSVSECFTRCFILTSFISFYRYLLSMFCCPLVLPFLKHVF